MITNIYCLDNIRTVYRYLEYTTLAKQADKKVMNDACKLLRKGKPLTKNIEKQLADLFALYNGTTYDSTRFIFPQ
jgi:hypothetical protein